MEKGASTTQMGVLSLLRIAIGWHFLSEGLGKLLNGGWTARDYLATADGPLAFVFRWMADTPAVLSAVDVVNVWGQVAIGLGLMLGLVTQVACVAGAILLAFYYVARPPIFLVSPILVEMLALVGLASVPTGRAFGLDRLLARRRRNEEAEAGPRQAVEGPAEGREPGSPLTDRRDLLKGLSGVPFVAALGAVTGAHHVWPSHEERDLVDAFSGASRKPLALTSLSDLKGRVPSGTIRGKQISRIILGGNIICGLAHSRDLIYVSATLRAIAEHGIQPDFWMKTFHPDNYWSHRHPEEHDNKYCYNAAETVAFMHEREEAWIAFKVMAAGSVKPQEAFRYAFESGADYICAGMYDFQMVEDANIAVETLDQTRQRPRRWSV